MINQELVKKLASQLKKDGVDRNYDCPRCGYGIFAWPQAFAL